MFVNEARRTDEGRKATLIVDLEMNEINDHKPRTSYLSMSLPITIRQRPVQFTLFEIKLEVPRARVFKVTNQAHKSFCIFYLYYEFY
jgi:hypothetical protein